MNICPSLFILKPYVFLLVFDIYFKLEDLNSKFYKAGKVLTHSYVHSHNSRHSNHHMSFPLDLLEPSMDPYLLKETNLSFITFLSQFS